MLFPLIWMHTPDLMFHISLGFNSQIHLGNSLKTTFEEGRAIDVLSVTFTTGQSESNSCQRQLGVKEEASVPFFALLVMRKCSVQVLLLQHSQSSLQSSLFVYKHAVASQFCYNWTLPLAAATYSSKDADLSCIEIPSQCWFVIEANGTVIFLSDDLKWYVSLKKAQGESVIDDDTPFNNS